MPILTTTRTYADGEVLTKSELDAPFDDIETFVNTTKLNDDNIQNSGITGSTKLLNASVSGAKLANNAITTAKIADDSVTTAKILDEAVTNDKISALAVDTAQLAANAVTTAKITDANITTAKLANNAVTDTKLSSSASVDADRAVGTDHIKASAVIGSKILDGSITPAKSSTNYVSGTVSALRTTAGTTYGQLSSLTTTGRPVMIIIYGGSINANGGGVRTCILRVNRFDGVSTHTTVATLYNNAGQFTTHNFGAMVSTTTESGGMTFIDTPAAGTWTYEVETTVDGGIASFGWTNAKLFVYEL